jgi:hypothetical protein
MMPRDVATIAVLRGHIFDAISAERKHQDGKHGPIDIAPHQKGTWTLLIEAELAEAKQALIKGGTGRDSWSHELIQVAALCVAALEQHGIEEGNGKREI